MLKAEPLIGVARCKSILRGYDNGRLRQQERGTRPCPGRLSRFDARWVKVLVVIFREIVEAASKQADDPVGGMRRYFSSIYNWTAARSRSSDFFRRLLTLQHCQSNSLSIFEPDLGERLKNPVFVKSFDRFCHE